MATTVKLSRMQWLEREVRGLQAELAKLRAQDLATIAKAYHQVQHLSIEEYMASGLIITVENLSGVTVMGPVLISDGLSGATREALRGDLRRTYEDRLLVNPIEKET